jgi:hypothetical protein
MDAGRGVFDEMQNGPAAVGIEIVTFGRKNRANGRARMLHRHEFGRIIRAKRPRIADLMAMRIDDLDRLPFGEANRLAMAGRNRVVMGMTVVIVRH